MHGLLKIRYATMDVPILKTKGFMVIERRGKGGKPWHYIKRKNGVAVLAVTEKNEIIFVEQKRPILKKALLEIPAGGIASVNSRISLIREAKRELLEETGFRAKKVGKIGEFYPSPGYYTEKTFIFLASELSSGKKNLTALEKKNNLKVVKKTFDQALKDVLHGKITDAKTVMAILIHNENKRGLRKAQTS